ncbi:MAG TPA: alanine racemase [Byssovorax sp.]|jgi:diaminopimelate decarboxylase
MIQEPVDLSHVAAEILAKRDALLASAARGTPAYAFDRAAFGAALDAFERAFSRELPGHRAFYAVKSNHHPLVVEEAARRGFGLDVSSGRELEQALALDGAPILFSGPAKAPAELERAVLHADRVTVHLDSFRELERLGDATTKLGRAITAGVRVSTERDGAWSKFGVPLDDLARFVRAARAHPLVDLRGVQFHSSWHRDATPFARALEDLARVIARDLTGEELARLAFVDVGGGYRPHALEGEFTADESAGAGRSYRMKPSIPIDAYARALGDAFRAHLAPLVSARAYTEPGRVVSTHAMHLLLRVVDKKADDLVIVDGGVNMVGWEKYLHVACPVVNLTRPSLAEIPVRIGGSLCDCEDVWGFHCFAERIEEGDVLVVPMQGAYGWCVAQSFIRDVPEVRELDA